MAGVAAPSSGDRVIGNQQQHLSPQEDAEVAKGGWDDWDEVRIDWDIPMGQGWDTWDDIGTNWDDGGGGGERSPTSPESPESPEIENGT